MASRRGHVAPRSLVRGTDSRDPLVDPLL
jgi:hypothetical protein